MVNRPGETLASDRLVGAPLLVTAELPADVLAWADALRRAHYPPERNRLRAHVTLFHALPPSVEDEIVQVMNGLAGNPAPEAFTRGLLRLEQGTAIRIESRGMVEMHGVMAERMHGLLPRQDTRSLQLHVTVQNKVSQREAQSLQRELAVTLQPRSFRFRGFGLYAWEAGLWRPIKMIIFRR